jgi:hypothetical protein
MNPHRVRAGAAVLALAAVALPGSAQAGERAAAAKASFAELPPEAASFLQQAQQQSNTENLMFAQFTRPRHKGYRWGVTAYKVNPSARTRLVISFARSALEGSQRQSSMFHWTLPRGALRMDRDLKPSSLVTGKGMGSNGRISMKLSGPSQFGRVRPEGCTGSISYRVGTFAGTFRFDAHDEYFGVITFPRTIVAIYRAKDLRCDEPETSAPCPSHLSLSAVDSEAGVAVGAFKTLEGRVDQSVVVVGTSGRARTVHNITVTAAAPDAFEAADDLTSASVDGDAGAPLLSGDLEYLAPLPAAAGTDDCGGHQTTSGLATGDYTAHFDSIGAVTPASTGLSATLRREDP